MNPQSYWKQKATPWVSFAVLAGGLVAACMLLFIWKVESGLHNLGPAGNIYSEFED